MSFFHKQENLCYKSGRSFGFILDDRNCKKAVSWCGVIVLDSSKRLYPVDINVCKLFQPNASIQVTQLHFSRAQLFKTNDVVSYVSLKLWSLNVAYTLIFLLENVSSFCICKSYSYFFSQNTCELDSVHTRTVNILTTNELVKLTMLWTTGPRSSDTN